MEMYPSREHCMKGGWKGMREWSGGRREKWHLGNNVKIKLDRGGAYLCKALALLEEEKKNKIMAR